MFGAFGKALPDTCITFVSAARTRGHQEEARPGRQVMAIRNTRRIGKRDMVRNSGTPKIEVSPETFAVTVDGKHATVKPLKTVSLNQVLLQLIPARRDPRRSVPATPRTLSGGAGAAAVDELALDHWEAQKNRFRKKTAGGVELAVSLDRGTFMRDGDVLLCGREGCARRRRPISLRDVMIVHLDGLGRSRRHRHAHLRRARPRARQPALARPGEGQPRVCRSPSTAR
jgi:hypothetical protein